MSNETEKKPDVVGKTTMIGHVLIKDKDTQEVLVNQRDGLLQQRSLGKRNAR